MADSFKALVCDAYTQNVNLLSLHEADPGMTGANDSGMTHEEVSWSDPYDGVSSANVSINGLEGHFTHIGLWYNNIFRQALPCKMDYDAPVDIIIMISHEVDEEEEQT